MSETGTGAQRPEDVTLLPTIIQWPGKNSSRAIGRL